MAPIPREADSVWRGSVSTAPKTGARGDGYVMGWRFASEAAPTLEPDRDVPAQPATLGVLGDCREAQSARRARIVGLDAARACAVVLVIALHVLAALPALPRTGPVGAVHALTAFAVPLFFVVSGFLSQGRRSSLRTIQHLASRLLVPYVLWSVVYGVTEVALGLRTFSVQSAAAAVAFGQASWHLWFLPALFICQVVGLWVGEHPRRLYATFLVTAPFAIAGAAGLGDGVARLFLSYSALGWLPVFLLGSMVARRDPLRMRGPLVLSTCSAGVAAVAAIGWTGYGAQPLARLVSTILAVVVAMLVVKHVATNDPRRGLRWADALGPLVLSTYLVHMLPVDLIRASGLASEITSTAGFWAAWVGVTVLSFMLARAGTLVRERAF